METVWSVTNGRRGLLGSGYSGNDGWGRRLLLLNLRLEEWDSFFSLFSSDGPPEIWIAKYAERVHLAIFLGFTIPGSDGRRGIRSFSASLLFFSAEDLGVGWTVGLFALQKA